MKKAFSGISLFFILVIITSVIILSTIGIKTNKFNNLISNKINQTNNNIKLDLKKIIFKIDLKKFSLFLETANPKLEYRSVSIPVREIKVYVDFLSLLQSDTRIKRVNLTLEQLNIQQLKEISFSFKPSNFTSIINNKLIGGELNTVIDIFFDNNNLLDNFIAKGSVSNLEASINKDLTLENTNFDFFADKSDILIKKIFSKTEVFQIKDGDLKINLSSDINLIANFKTIFSYNSKLRSSISFLQNFDNLDNLIALNAEFNNSFNIDLDKTYKIKKYDYRLKGKIFDAKMYFKKPIKNYFLSNDINQISIKNTKIETNFNPKKNKSIIEGKYSINNSTNLNFTLENIFSDKSQNLKINFDLDRLLELNLINYQKAEKKVANIYLNLKKSKDDFKIEEFRFSENNTNILMQDLKFRKGKFSSLKNISVKTSKNDKKNNDFNVRYGNEILIEGNLFDATNLLKTFNKKDDENLFSKINKNIEIDFANIIFSESEKLQSFKLIGKIQKGKFTKISSKGDFGNNNFLDITMKNDSKNKRKYFEIYSDLTKPLLTEYSFFNGLSGGKLFYSSIIENDYSTSKLKIENFKVVNAPGMVKLLSLADLGGLADLAEGEGLSFDILEIQMEKNKENLKLNEILALGPSVSILMEGYQNSSVTSLRGTLVPAKSLNKLISKIPVIGEIVIPKEIGEGLFGISFKMKGPPGKIKTTINPIRTITPRFIQKIVDRNKKSK